MISSGVGINTKYFSCRNIGFCLVFLFITLYIYFLLNIDTSFLDPDLYYHLAIARLYSEFGKVDILTWGNDWIFKNSFGDTHLLFHQVLRLQNWIPVKLIISILVALSVVVFLWIHKLKSISQIVGFTLLFLFGSYGFTGRFLFAKGLLLFLPLFFLYYYFWKKQSNKIIFLLAFISVWSYPLSPLIMVFSSIDLVITFFLSKRKNLLWRPFFYSSFGFLSGLIFHPSFPNQFKIFYIEWVLQIFQPAGLEKIAEWAAPDTQLFLISFVVIIIIGIIHFKDSDNTLGFLFFIGLIASYTTTKSIEWTVPIGFLWIASSEKFRANLDLPFSKQMFLPIAIIGTSLLGSGVYEQLKSQNNEKREYASFLCRKLSIDNNIWLNWDKFQEFVYECPNKIYTFGLNPLYSFANDKERYSLIQKFWHKPMEDNSNIPIYLGYNTAIIFPESESREILNHMIKNPAWELKYIFNHAFVFLNKANPDTNQKKEMKIINKNFNLPNNIGN